MLELQLSGIQKIYLVCGNYFIILLCKVKYLREKNSYDDYYQSKLNNNKPSIKTYIRFILTTFSKIKAYYKKT